MKLDTDTFAVNEEKSNHAVAAMMSSQCPKKQACFGMATGFGGAMVPMCADFKATDEGAECLYEEPDH